MEKEHTRATEPAFAIDLSMPEELKLREEGDHSLAENGSLRKILVRLPCDSLFDQYEDDGLAVLSAVLSLTRTRPGAVCRQSIGRENFSP
jgi:hypothetical protein